MKTSRLYLREHRQVLRRFDMNSLLYNQCLRIGLKGNSVNTNTSFIHSNVHAPCDVARAEQEAEAARLDVLKARLIAEEMHASIELKEAEQEVWRESGRGTGQRPQRRKQPLLKPHTRNK